MKDEHKAKEDFGELSRAELINELAEMRQRTAELEAADTEHERAEQALRKQTHALRESEERYYSLFEGVPVGINLTTPEGQTLDANPALVHLLGYPDRETLLAVNVTDLYVDTDDRRRWQALIEREGIVRGFEVQLRRRDGTIIWVRSNARAICDADGRVLYYEGSLEDITERKRAEEELQRRNRELALINRASQAFTSTLDLDQVLDATLEEVRRLLDVSAYSVWLIDPLTGELVCRQATGPKGEVVRGWRLALGEGIVGWVAQHGESLIVPDTRADEHHFKGVNRQTGLELRSILGAPLRVKEKVIGVLEMVDTEVDRFTPAALRLVEPLAASAAIAIENARLYERAQQEITERKRAEEALRENEELLRATLESTADGILVVGEGGKMVHANTRFAEMWRIPQPVLDSRDDDTLLDFVLDQLQDPEAFLTKVRYLYGSSKDDLDILQFKDGRVFERFSRPLLQDGMIAGRVWSFRDITERTQAEEALRESEERHRLLFQNAPVGILSADATGHILAVNPAILRMLGSPSAEATRGINILTFPLLVKVGFAADFRRCLEEEITIVSERLYTSKWGKETYFKCHLTPIREADGQTTGFQAIIEDITERKRIEDALRESEQRLALAVDGSNGGQWHYELNPDDPMHAIGGAYFSPRLKSFIGYEDNEFPNSLAAWESRVVPEDLAVLLESSRAHRAGQKDSYEIEYRIRHKDGSIRWIYSCGRVRRDEHGRPIRFAGIDWDITERKRADNLIRTQRDLGLALSATPDLDEGLRLCVEAAIHVSEMDCGGVYLVDDASGALDLAFHQGLPPDFVRSASHYDADSASAGLVMAGKPIYTEHLNLGVSLNEVRQREGLRAIAVIPMHHEGRVIGCLNIASHTTDEVPVFSRNALETIATQISSAVARLGAEDALRRRAEELATLQATVLDITAPHDLPTLLQTIVERAARLLNAPIGGMYLCHPDRKEVRCVVSYNTPRDYTGTVLKYGEGAAGAVAQTGEPLIIDDYRTWSGRAAVYEEEQPFTTVLTTPMIWQGQVTGVIHVLHDVESRCFTQTDLELLTLFANHAAIAVENARLYEKALQDAKTKSFLLDEVNHRVKNTLVAIIGLLHVEQSYAAMADHAAYEAIIQNLTNRVSALATVHSLLSASEWAPLLLSDLAGQVIKSATQMCPRDKQVFIDAPPSPVRVTPDQAHNLALVINELATNTIQHTLPGRSTALISVRIALEDDGLASHAIGLASHAIGLASHAVLFEYRDDGPGYPEDVLRLERHAVGFDLIKNLTRQSLRGELSLHNDEGAVAVIRFPAQA